jgi:3-phosphoshikimate 1-carboxyvinyltransferase
MIFTTEKIDRVAGSLQLPGDKSISHRSVMFSAMSNGVSTINNCLRSEDLISTINCFRALGCEIDSSEEEIRVIGKGFKGFKKPAKPLECGNSGTTSRLISGILAAQDFDTTLIGDQSLSKRPMKRIVDPLIQMGALLSTSSTGTLPLTISATNNLHAIEYQLPVASAQVKSAVLLAGLHLDNRTIVMEHERTRNHTEKMLGLEVEELGMERKIYSSIDNYPQPKEYLVPSDISSASFFIVLTLLLPNSEILIKNVSLNPTRTGLIDVLIKMGGSIEVVSRNVSSGEEYGDLLVKSSKLQNISIDMNLIANIIDEIPILSVAGLFAEGQFEIRNAGELRHKESDRISALCKNYKLLSVNCEEYEDGFTLSGEVKDFSNVLQSYGDHRIAMTFGILGSLLYEPIKINNFECLSISNPNFLKQVQSITI